MCCSGSKQLSQQIINDVMHFQVSKHVQSFISHNVVNLVIYLQTKHKPWQTFLVITCSLTGNRKRSDASWKAIAVAPVPPSKRIVPSQTSKEVHGTSYHHALAKWQSSIQRRRIAQSMPRRYTLSIVVNQTDNIAPHRAPAWCMWRGGGRGLIKCIQCHIWLTNAKFYFGRRRWFVINVIVRTLANISKYTISLILSKYCIKSINTNVNDIKLLMWKHFVDDCAEHGRVTIY